MANRFEGMFSVEPRAAKDRKKKDGTTYQTRDNVVLEFQGPGMRKPGTIAIDIAEAIHTACNGNDAGDFVTALGEACSLVRLGKANLPKAAKKGATAQPKVRLTAETLSNPEALAAQINAIRAASTVATDKAPDKAPEAAKAPAAPRQGGGLKNKPATT